MGLPPYLPPISQDAESSSGGHSPATMAVAVSPPAVATTVVTTAVVIGLRNQRVPCGCLADGVEVGRNSRRRRDGRQDPDDTRRVGEERPTGTDSAPIFIRPSVNGGVISGQRGGAISGQCR